MAIRVLAFAFRPHMSFVLQRDVDYFSFVAVHRLEDDLFTAALNPSGQPYSQLLQRFFSALAVVFYVQPWFVVKFVKY